MKVIRLLCIAAGLALASTAPALPPLPEKTFDCQVLATSGTHGLVTVQAASERRALVVAKGSMAWDMRSRRAPVQSVIECVEMPGGRFKDSSFQRFVEQLPR